MKTSLAFIFMIIIGFSCSKDCHLDFTSREPFIPEELDLDYYGIAIRDGEENWVGQHSMAIFDLKLNSLGIIIEQYSVFRDSLRQEQILFHIPLQLLEINNRYTVVRSSYIDDDNKNIVTGGYVLWDIDAFLGIYGIDEDCDKGFLILDEINEKEISGKFSISIKREEGPNPFNNPDHVNFTNGSFLAKVDTI